MTDQNIVLQLLTETGAVLDGHFLLSSGRHSGKYCQCARLFENPETAAKVVGTVAEKLSGVDYDLIVGPAMGGVIAAYELSRQTGVPNIFAERENNVMCLRRGFHIKPGSNVIIMEDVITTGKSTLEVAEVIKAAGGSVVGAACIVDRSGSPLPFPVYSALKLSIDTFDAADCSMCSNGLPLVKPGSRAIDPNK